jgi:Gpi18-like mannosyltransferase
VAVAVRLFFLDYMSNDYRVFLSKWVVYFRENGGFAALRGRIGDYNFPYLYFLALFSYIPVNDLYLIKFLSIAFDLLAALTAMKIVSVFTVRRHVLAGVFFLVSMLPTVVTNSSMWGQCDSIYASFGLFGLYFGLKKRPVLSVAFAAIAFSFKLQIVFLLPVYVVLLLAGNIRIRHLAVFPLVYTATVLPAILLGRPVTDAVTIYTNQVGLYSDYLTLNAPSVYAFFKDPKGDFLRSALGIAAAFVFLISLLLYIYLRRRRMDSRRILLSAALMVMFIPFLLPSMHERYFYLADVLTVACAFVNPILLPVPVLVQLASWSGYQNYLFGEGIGIRTGAVFMLVAALYTLAFFVRTVEVPLEKNGKIRNSL